MLPRAIAGAIGLGTLGAGDKIICLGAGDITKWAAGLAKGIEAARAARGDDKATGISKIVIRSVGIGADAILELLGMAKLKHPTDEARVRWDLDPWIVEAALERLGSKRLSKEEQREVWDATRTPHKVNWPEWWVIKG